MHQFTFEFLTVKKKQNKNYCQVQRQEMTSSILSVCRRFTFAIRAQKQMLLVEVEDVHILEGVRPAVNW